MRRFSSIVFDRMLPAHNPDKYSTRLRHIILLLVLASLPALSSCGDGNPRLDQTGVEAATVASSCDGHCATDSSLSPQATLLTQQNVALIVSQAVAEAEKRQQQATIAVVDRVGNVLVVFQMLTASPDITINSDGNTLGGLEGVNIVPAHAAAISKAITAAYLSTEGNAFSSRSLNQLIQENFNPGELNQASGALFGIQYSQLACSDFSERFTVGANVGPKRSPLGLSADPGGFPLYKSGTVVGGVGVITAGDYGIDRDINDMDRDLDEIIAWAASRGFAAPVARRADRSFIAGKSLRFSDVTFTNMLSTAEDVRDYLEISDPTTGVGKALLISGYSNGDILSGTSFGANISGNRASNAAEFIDLDAFVLVDNSNVERYPRIAANDSPGGDSANALTEVEVKQILASALGIANQARSQHRQPLASAARVTISVVDSDGMILGMVHSRDAPVFGSDVSIQKARTAAFFSRSGAANSPADALRALADPAYLDGGLSPLPGLTANFAQYVTDLQNFLGVATVLESNGESRAFSNRAIGNLSRPHYPDGPTAGIAGPLSKPAGQWSVFSTGLQLDLIYNAFIQHVAFLHDPDIVTDVIRSCNGIGAFPAFVPNNLISSLSNGIQISAGAVPIYRGNILVGAIGVSGDGSDQEDMIAFLALQRANQLLSTTVDNAPSNIRADKLTPQGIRLRYVSCPFAPFNGSSQQDVCSGN
ncbi:MAG: hypothetical protein ACC707_03440 [Thiohalomonadales bacterium]